MDSRGLSGGQYRPLSEEQLKTIHEASLTILETTGFTYESGLDETLEMLEKAGMAVDRARSRITFPRDLVTEQAAKAPQRVVLFSRDGKNDLDLTEHRVHLGTGGAAIKILDLHIPATAYDVNVFYACLKATGKHVMAGVNDLEGFHNILDLASMVAGGMEKLKEKPFISVITSFAISPLKLDTQTTLIMQEAVRNRIPVALSCAPMAGSTSPITMAGTLAQIHAEQLAGITICQLTNPGAPLLYGGIPGMANLRTMGYLGGAVECGMMNAAIHQLAHYIKVPNYNSSGLTDSKIPDAQAGWEKAMTTLLAAMGGSNYIHHAAGMLESMIAVAYEQYVIDDEIIGMSCRVLKGIDVDPEHLALEVIASVGPGGNFMTSPHTLEHMRDEYFNGNGVADRKSRQKWEKEGSSDARDRARKKAKEILATHQPEMIPPEIDAQIRKRFEILL